MKTVFVVIIAVAAVFCLYAAPAIAEEEIGDYVHAAPLPANAALLPPGQFALVASYLDRYLSTPPGAVNGRWQWADQLNDGIDDPAKADEIGDFFVVDVRTPAEFCGGHIHNAVNIPLDSVAKPENLMQLPTDKPILLVCTTAHQGTAAATALGTLGYNVYMLRFGMASWKAVTTTKITSAKTTVSIYGLGLPVEKCQQ